MGSRYDSESDDEYDESCDSEEVTDDEYDEIGEVSTGSVKEYKALRNLSIAGESSEEDDEYDESFDSDSEDDEYDESDDSSDEEYETSIAYSMLEAFCESLEKEALQTQKFATVARQKANNRPFTWTETLPSEKPTSLFVMPTKPLFEAFPAQVDVDSISTKKSWKAPFVNTHKRACSLQLDSSGLRGQESLSLKGKSMTARSEKIAVATKQKGTQKGNGNGRVVGGEARGGGSPTSIGSHNDRGRASTKYFPKTSLRAGQAVRTRSHSATHVHARIRTSSPTTRAAPLDKIWIGSRNPTTTNSTNTSTKSSPSTTPSTSYSPSPLSTSGSVFDASRSFSSTAVPSPAPSKPTAAARRVSKSSPNSPISARKPTPKAKTRKWASRYKDLKISRDLTPSNDNDSSIVHSVNHKLLEVLGDTEKHYSPLELKEKVADEIVRTEEDYVKDLEIIIKMYIKPLRLDENHLTDEEIATVFLNIEELHGISSAFLDKLKKTEGTNIGNAFTKQNIMPLIEGYGRYCGLYKSSLSALSNYTATKYSFSTFLEYTALQPICKNMQLASYLIKPVQRICKYPLLLKELMKYTNKTSDEYKTLQSAARDMEQIVHAINHLQACMSEIELKKKKKSKRRSAKGTKKSSRILRK